MLVSKKIANLLNGVSQRPPSQRLSSQAENQINALSSVAHGVRKRPPMLPVGEFTDTPTGWEDAFVHSINRRTDERYHIVVANGEIKAYDADDAQEVPVLFEGGDVSTPPAEDYLADPAGAGFRAATVGDNTIIVNRGVTVRKGTTKSSFIFGTGALVFVRQADYSTRYSITLDGITVAVKTVDQTTPSSRTNISTEAIAADLMAVLQAETQFLPFFTFTRYGSTIHIQQVEGVTFALEVSDGLADQGLKAVKGSVQDFLDLPSRAPAGFIVEITGSPESPRDNYYVIYDDSTTPGQDGVWRECPKPGVLVDFDPATLPHRLVRKGSVVRDKVHFGLPRVIARVFQDTNQSVTNVSWFEYLDTQAIAANKIARVQDHDTGVRKVVASGAVRLAVRYGLDVSALEQGAGLWVRLYLNDSKIAERFHEAGADTAIEFTGPMMNTLTRENPFQKPGTQPTAPPPGTGTPFRPDDPRSFTLLVDEDIDTSDELEVRLEYATGTTPETYRRAVLSFEPDSLTLYSAIVRSVVFSPTDIFPAGSDVVIATFDSTPVLGVYPEIDRWTYTVGSSDETAAEVATGLAAVVDADADYEATASGNIVYVERADGTDFLLGIPSDTYYPVDLIFHNPNLGLAGGELVGLIIRNLTDGSEGEITANGESTITVATLTGGADNTFQPGDLVMVVEEGRYFVFEQCPWKDRDVGDDTTNPYPSFVDNEIVDVFFHANRLGFLSNENVVLSSSGDLFNFFRYTATDLRADDLIDIKSAHAEITIFHSALLWNKQLTIWADNVQFVLAGEPVLSPSTVRLQAIGNHPNSAAVRPIAVGDRVFFVRSKSGHTQVFELRLATDDDGNITTRSTDLTKDLPTYVAGQAVTLVGDAAEGFLALLTNADQSKLFVYSFLYSRESQPLQTSWSRWEFAPSTFVVGLDMADGVLGVLHKQTDGAFLSHIDLDLTPNGTFEKVSYLDRRLSEDDVTAAFSVDDNWTTWTLPFDIAINGSEGTLVVANRTTKAVLVTTRPAPNQIRFTGANLAAADVYIGLAYGYRYQPSTLYLRDENDVPETRGRLQLRGIDVQYRDSTDFTVQVTLAGRSARNYVFGGASLLVPESGTLHVPTIGRNEDATIIIRDDTPGPVTITELDWEGWFTLRSRRM